MRNIIFKRCSTLTIGFLLSLSCLKSQEPAVLQGLSYEAFQRLYTSSDKLVLVNFSADWCVVCKKEKPVLDQIRNKYRDSLILLEVDMEKNPLIAEKYEVDALPVTIIYRNGEMVWNRVGFQSITDLETVIWQYRLKKKKK